MLKSRSQKLLMVTLVFALMLTLIPTMPAFAEGETMTMKQLYYSVWPEYDKAPDVLVIYSGVFVNDTGAPFQGELRYKVPKNANINMVCETEKGMLCQKYVVDKDNPDYDVIVWKPSHPVEPGAEFPVMMEYYHQPFAAGSSPKAFTETFRPAFPVETLAVDIKAPTGASEIALTPEAQQTESDAEGFTSYYYQYTNLTNEDAFTFDVSYVRESNEPSVDPGTGQGAPQEDSSSQAGSTNTMVIVLLLVFVALLSVFLFIAINNNNKQNQNKGKGKKGNKGNQGKGGGKGASAKKSSGKTSAEEKRKLRKMLIDGKISEETYHQLLEEIDD
ncbi:hypothetical protein MFMK1_000487 [Metallumcola ferriviriculae]|uniref:SHOCT domain-containing protein n=1 Tax=Metallumcola ferriviriculae TaxID=3039180 RepID=A0AAU0UNC6_9FIRM|nr:hypothetical protein MFMK1_000487 [Desulfitibacteraceae bacterium MK1]